MTSLTKWFIVGMGAMFSEGFFIGWWIGQSI